VTVDPKPRIAERAARELRSGEIVNLGIGIPNLIPGFLSEDAGVFLHTENGLLGVGPRPSDEEVDPDLIDAAKRPVTALPGASYFDSAASFAMIRGGHVDVAVLGALQVSAGGDIANWAVPGKDVLGVGGAMDLVVGARRVIVTMTATSSSGEPKVVRRCRYPLTAAAAADVIVTELCVFRRNGGALTLTELLGDATLADVESVTEADFNVVLEELRYVTSSRPAAITLAENYVGFASGAGGLSTPP
jgi:3-oxoacid CoA-transferase B subunit